VQRDGDLRLVRVGISKAAERQWRFAVEGSRYLSKPL
jgi:3-methyladenine DNA glycosylase Mpg